MSVVTLILASVLLSPLGTGQPTTGMAASAASAFVGNAYFFTGSGGYFQPVAAANPFLHTWSLSVEEQFYLFFPLLLIAAWQLTRTRRRSTAVAILVAVFLASFAADLMFSYDWLPHVPGLRRLSTNRDLANRFAFYSPFTRAWEFLGGVLITLLARHRGTSRNSARAAAVLGVALIAISATMLNASMTFPGIAAILPVAGAMLLIRAGTSENPISAGLSRRPMVAIGGLSYSWYLWHWPAIVFAKTWYPFDRAVWIVAAIGSLIPAYLSYRWVELPIHKGWRFSGRRSTAVIAVVCLSVGVLGGQALRVVSNHSWGRSDIAAIETDVRPEHVDIIDGCASIDPLGSVNHPPCVWSVPHSKGTILLVGDSNAGHFSEPMIAASRRLGMNLQIATDGGCPFIVGFSALAACRSWAQKSLAYAVSRPKAYSAIVLSNASVGYLSVSNFPGAQRTPAILRWAADMRTTVERLTRRSPVILIGAVPQFGQFPDCLMRSILQRHRSATCGHLSPAAAATQRDSVIAAERGAILGLNASYYDTAGRLCSAAGGCDSYVDGSLVYRDGVHLSVPGSFLFTGDLQRSLTLMLATRDVAK